MSGKIVRQRYMRQFAGMEKYSRLFGWSVLAFYFVQILAAGVAGHFLLSSGATFGTVGGALLLALFIATRMRGLNNIVHECSHFTFTAHRQDNVRIGSICASAVMGCYHDYREEHLSHHAHLGDYEHDMDLAGIEALRLHEPLTMLNVLRHLTNPFWGRHLPYYFNPNLSPRDGEGYWALKVGLVALGFAFTLWQPLTGLVMIMLPYLFLYPTLNYWTDCLDHAGVVGAEDELDASRNVLAPKWIRVLFFPRNDCFHLVHHLFPHIPARHLEASHKILSEDAIYQQKQNAMKPVHVVAGKGINQPKHA